MNFTTLLDALRALAEENANALGPLGSNLMAETPTREPPTLQTWTLQPDQIEVLVAGIESLYRQNLQLDALLALVPGNGLVEKTQKLTEWNRKLQAELSSLKHKN